MAEQPPKFESEESGVDPIVYPEREAFAEAEGSGAPTAPESDTGLRVIPIDKNIFRAAEDAAERVTDESKRKFLDMGILRGKYSSFEYAQWFLGRIVDDPASPEKGSRWEELEKDQSHKLAGGFAILRPTISYAGARLPKYSDTEKETRAYKTAALSYALQSARDFLDLKKEHADWDDARIADELHIPPDAPISELIKKGRELPSGVPERSFFDLP